MNKITKQNGQIIINTLLLVTISMTLISAITSPVLSSLGITRSFLKTNQSLILANSVSNEALYRLSTNKKVSTSETVSLYQGIASINVSDITDGKIVSVISNVDSYIRKFEIKLLMGEGIRFNYGMQVGQGGIEISGSSGIIGNIYSNGNIIGDGKAYVTGTAISANISNSTTLVSNSGVVDPLYQVSFGGEVGPQDLAQSFYLNSSSVISNVRFLIKKSGSATMNDITLRIVSDNNNQPGKTILSSAVVSASTITNSFGYINIPFSNLANLTQGTRYWLLFDSPTNFGQSYVLGANDSVYTIGQIKNSTGWNGVDGGFWSNTSSTTLDIYFDLYTGDSTGTISGVKVGQNGLGNAWAYQVDNSNVEGSLYCKVGFNNNKLCNTERPNPIQQEWPISDGNISEWKEIASSGGSTTTISISGSGNTLNIGPLKINGDLLVSSGATVLVGGTVYVTGDVIVSSNAFVQVNPDLKSKSIMIIADGRIQSFGGGVFSGSGDPESYILLTSTSNCPDNSKCLNTSAIDIGGICESVVLNAQNGTVEFGGGAKVKQVTGKKIKMSGGSTIMYDSNISNSVFFTEPSGSSMSWFIDSWKEVE